jgi:hypothetical protein
LLVALAFGRRCDRGACMVRVSADLGVYLFVVVAIQNPTSQVALDFIVGEFHPRVTQECRESWPLAMHVTEGLAQSALGLDVRPSAVSTPSMALASPPRSASTSLRHSCALQPPRLPPAASTQLLVAEPSHMTLRSV